MTAIATPAPPPKNRALFARLLGACLIFSEPREPRDPNCRGNRGSAMAAAGSVGGHHVSPSGDTPGGLGGGEEASHGEI